MGRLTRRARTRPLIHRDVARSPRASSHLRSASVARIIWGHGRCRAHSAARGRSDFRTLQVRTPVRAPQENAYAERWVGALRRECLDWVLVLGRRHLEGVLAEYLEHYNAHRPHRGLDLRAPDASANGVGPIAAPSPFRVRRRDRLGGLIHEYRMAA